MSEVQAPVLRRVTEILLLLFVVSLPVLSWAVEAGVALTASHVFGVLLIGVSCWTMASERRWPAIDLAYVALLAFAAVATVTVIGVLGRPDLVVLGESIHNKAVKQLAGLYFAVALFVGLRYLMETTGSGLRMLRVYFVTAVAVAVLALLQYGAALRDLDSPLAVFPVSNSTLGEARSLVTGNSRYGFPRVALTLIEPSRLSMYLLTAWAIWAYGAARSASVFTGRWFHVSGVILGTAILVSGSRLGYVVFFTLIVLAIVLRPGRLRRAGLIGASAVFAATLIGPGPAVRLTATLLPERAAAAVVAWAPEPGAVSASTAVGAGATEAIDQASAGVPNAEDGASWRPAGLVEQRLHEIGSRSDMSVRQRIGSVLVVLDVMRDRPLLGDGYGTSEFSMASRYPDSMGPLSASGVGRPSLLSGPGAIVAETGLLGALSIAALFVGALGAVLKVGRYGATDLAWALVGALAAFGISASFKTLEVYQFLIVWFLLAVALAMPSALRSDSDSGLAGQQAS